MSERRLLYSMIILFVIDFALSGALLLFLSRVDNQHERHLQATCGFFRHVATAPVPQPKSGKPPAEIIIVLITDARAAYAGIPCSPPLPDPPPLLRRWARFYGLPAR